MRGLVVAPGKAVGARQEITNAEENVSTENPPPCSRAWFSTADEVKGGPQCTQYSASPRAASSDCSAESRQEGRLESLAAGHGRLPERAQSVRTWAAVIVCHLVLVPNSMIRERRLKHSDDFARVRREGGSWTHRFLVLGAAPNGQGLSRFGLIASRRLGTAVRRNRAKRLLREAIHRNMECIAEGWDCVLIARTPTSTASLAEVESAVVELLQRASLWLGPSQERCSSGASSRALTA